MKIKLKNGEYLEVDFWSFAWKSYLATLVTGIIVYLVFYAVLFSLIIMFGW